MPARALALWLLLVCALGGACTDPAAIEAAHEHLADGDAAMRSGRYTEAVASYGRASDLAPDDPEPLRKSALALVVLGRNDAALLNFEAAVERGSELPASDLVFWATALQRLGRRDEAIAKYEEALTTDPEDASALNNLGLLLVSRDTDRARGIALLERAVRARPGDANLVYNLGRGYQQVGRHEEAVDLIQRALASTSKQDPAYARRLARLRESKAKLGDVAPPPDAPNLLLVVIDTLRADHVGAYGYARDTTPTLDALAREGVLFEHAISQAPWTAASVASLFTGLHPSVHGLDGGVRWGPGETSAGGSLPFAVQKALTPAQRTLPEILQRHGYRTAGFVSNVYVHSIFGFAQGFELYDDEHRDYSRDIGRVKRRAENTNARVFEWLDTKPREPFFLFVHYNDPHWPYDPPSPHGRDYVADYAGALTPADTFAVVNEKKPIDAADLAYVIGLYDGEIAYADAQLGRLLARLRAGGLERPLLTVITADHGEEFQDHGGMSHGFTLYEEQIRVPLVVHLPAQISPRRVGAPVRLIDLAPTLLELAGIDAEAARFQGASLVPLLTGSTPSGPGAALSEATYLGTWKSLRRNGLKWIENLEEGPTLLFDLEQDPTERTDLASRQVEQAAEMRAALAEWIDRNRKLRAELHPESEGLEEVVLDEETQERLRSLGYIH